MNCVLSTLSFSRLENIIHRLTSSIHNHTAQKLSGHRCTISSSSVREYVFFVFFRFQTRSSAVAAIADCTACKFAVRTPLHVHSAHARIINLILGHTRHASESAVAPNGTVPTRGLCRQTPLHVYWDLGALRFYRAMH